MDLILRSAKISDSLDCVDIGIQTGKIATIEPAGALLANAPSIATHDLAGKVLLPGLVDAHTHLDKAFSTLENKSGTLAEAISVWHAYRQTRTADDIRTSAEKALNLAIRNGVTTMRSHIDIGTIDELLPVEVLLDLREAYKGKIDLQLVALGTAAGRPEWRQGMIRALEMGVDLIGGAPALCADPMAEIDAIFEIAAETGKAIDLHIDETEDPKMLSLEYLAEMTLKYGMQGRVTAGHCCSLAFVDDEVAKRVINKVAEAGINIVTLPSCNLVLMGRGISPTPRGITPVKQLLAGGVNVCAASDNVRDPFNPFGNYDLLQIANLNAHVAQMTGEAELYESLAMVTSRAAECVGLGPGQISVGAPADLVVIDCKQVIETVLAPPRRLAVYKRGILYEQ